MWRSVKSQYVADTGAQRNNSLRVYVEFRQRGAANLFSILSDATFQLIAPMLACFCRVAL